MKWLFKHLTDVAVVNTSKRGLSVDVNMMSSTMWNMICIFSIIVLVNINVIINI